MRHSTTLLQLQALQTCLFSSVQLDDQLRPEWVATRPWLAFQAKAMVKTTSKLLDLEWAPPPLFSGLLPLDKYLKDWDGLEEEWALSEYCLD